MNQATRTNVSVLGVIFGLSGFSHGLFEALQGNKPTEQLIINAVGESHLMWEHGGEPALALIPNFLVSGIIAMTFSIALIVWSIFFMHKKTGPTVYLILFIVLLLFGGGVAQIIFFPWFWLVATRISKPLNWWREKLPSRLKPRLAKLWIWVLVNCAALLTISPEIAFTGFLPFIKDTEVLLSIMMVSLIAVVLLLPVVFISGFAYDIINNE